MSESATNPIRDARLAKGLSQEELGRQIGVEKAAVSKWENGQRFPRPRQAKALAKALGIAIVDLYRQAA